MSRKRTALPEGDRPIVNPGIAKTRYRVDFRTADGALTGQLEELIQRVGVRLQLDPGEPPYVVPGKPLVGQYDTGTQFKINKASLFTNTSKMPGPSFAIPAGPPAFGGTCPASGLGENVSRSRQIMTERSGIEIKRVRLPVLQGLGDDDAPKGLTSGVAASYDGDESFLCRSCYALSGNYGYPSKQVNDMMHLAWIKYELSQGGPERLGYALAYAIQHVNMVRPEGFQPYFRIHDAGDFFSEEYLEAWVVCASLMTHMRFWAPTRQWVFAKWIDSLRSAQDRVRAAGGWLVIRPSVLRIGDPAPMIPGLSAGSGCSSEEKDPCIWACPVYNKLVPRPQPDGSVKMEEAGSCLEANCTMCWDQPAVPVSYGAH